MKTLSIAYMLFRVKFFSIAFIGIYFIKYLYKNKRTRRYSIHVLLPSSDHSLI